MVDSTFRSGTTWYTVFNVVSTRISELWGNKAVIQVNGEEYERKFRDGVIFLQLFNQSTWRKIKLFSEGYRLFRGNIFLLALINNSWYFLESINGVMMSPGGRIFYAVVLNINQQGVPLYIFGEEDGKYFVWRGRFIVSYGLGYADNVVWLPSYFGGIGVDLRSKTSNHDPVDIRFTTNRGLRIEVSGKYVYHYFRGRYSGYVDLGEILGGIVSNSSRDIECLCRLYGVGFSRFINITRELSSLRDLRSKLGPHPRVYSGYRRIYHRFSSATSWLRRTYNYSIVSILSLLFLLGLSTYLVSLLFINPRVRILVGVLFLATPILSLHGLYRGYIDLIVHSPRCLPESDISVDISLVAILLVLFVLFIAKGSRIGRLECSLQASIFYPILLLRKRRVRTVLMVFALTLIFSSAFSSIRVISEFFPQQAVLSKITANKFRAITISLGKTYYSEEFIRYIENITGGRVSIRGVYWEDIYRREAKEVYLYTLDGRKTIVFLEVYLPREAKDLIYYINSSLIEGRLGSSGIIISDFLADELGVSAGDYVLRVERVGRQWMETKMLVAGVFSSKRIVLEDIDGDRIAMDRERLLRSIIFFGIPYEGQVGKKIVVWDAPNLLVAAYRVVEETGLPVEVNVGGRILYVSYREKLFLGGAEALVVVLFVALLSAIVVYGCMVERGRELSIIYTLGANPSTLQMVVLGEVLAYWLLSINLSVPVSGFMLRSMGLGVVDPISLMIVLLLSLCLSIAPVFLMAREATLMPTPGIPLRYRIEVRKGEYIYSTYLPVILEEWEKGKYLSWLEEFLRREYAWYHTGRRGRVRRVGETIYLEVEDLELRAWASLEITLVRRRRNYIPLVRVRRPRYMLQRELFDILCREVIDSIRKNSLTYRVDKT